ncbi:MAG: translation initiation factor IF-2 subunit alpha [Candidatus Altiarchaeales archaeon ex4484_96]|nr:MAG: translation initiation factor IF-2 subunit alpha [Candidatus Altiarchaeales archaeon ex4484_96]
MTEGKNKKNEYPEEGEIVIGTVENIFKQGAFVTLDEYNNKRGMLHISEISLKWVRNIRDYVREGQKTVVQVLRIKADRGHIDLSLRRVSEAQKREKLQDVKQKQRADKLLEIFAKSKKIPVNEVTDALEKKLIEKYGSVYEGLEAITSDNTRIDELEVKNEWRDDLLKLINENIKVPYVEVTGYVKLKSYQPDAVDKIREALKRIKEHQTESEITVLYDSPPIYRVNLKSEDYKTAEKDLRDSTKEGIDFFKKNKGTAEFFREILQEA